MKDTGALVKDVKDEEAKRNFSGFPQGFPGFSRRLLSVLGVLLRALWAFPECRHIRRGDLKKGRGLVDRPLPISYILNLLFNTDTSSKSKVIMLVRN